MKVVRAIGNKELWGRGSSIPELMFVFGRSRGGITSRLRKLQVR